jgi:hypothetical protein
VNWALPWLIKIGNTVEQARNNLTEALELFFEHASESEIDFEFLAWILKLNIKNFMIADALIKHGDRKDYRLDVKVEAAGF